MILRFSQSELVRKLWCFWALDEFIFSVLCQLVSSPRSGLNISHTVEKRSDFSISVLGLIFSRKIIDFRQGVVNLCWVAAKCLLSLGFALDFPSPKLDTYNLSSEKECSSSTCHGKMKFQGAVGALGSFGWQEGYLSALENVALIFDFPRSEMESGARLQCSSHEAFGWKRISVTVLSRHVLCRLIFCCV